MPTVGLGHTPATLTSSARSKRCPNGRCALYGPYGAEGRERGVVAVSEMAASQQVKTPPS